MASVDFVAVPNNYAHITFDDLRLGRTPQESGTTCPFPYDLIQRDLKRYPNVEIVWFQEEAMNMGAFSYISPRQRTAMRSLGREDTEDIKYVGRGPSAATATGFYTFHVKDQAELVPKAIGKEPIN